MYMIWAYNGPLKCHFAVILCFLCTNKHAKLFHNFHSLTQMLTIWKYQKVNLFPAFLKHETVCFETVLLSKYFHRRCRCIIQYIYWTNELPLLKASLFFSHLKKNNLIFVNNNKIMNITVFLISYTASECKQLK